VRFRFVEAEKAFYPVRLLCRCLAVSRAGFYAWRRRAPSPRALEDTQLSVEIRASHAESRRTYGSPRVLRDLRDRGRRVSRKRVARLMRECGLVARRRRRFRATTDSKHAFPVAANVLMRDFEVSAPNTAWVTDITFIWTRQGWLYLAVILDVFSRRVVGWATGQHVDRHLALTALDMALARRCPRRGLVHHSDRGSTYASRDYRRALESRGIKCSMSRKGDCWDNAVAESFFATLKREMEEIDNLESWAAANLSIGEYIDGFYNPRRRHSALNYSSPIEFELMHSVKKAA